jgi:D-amino-acid dehydrogenase
MQPPSSDSSNRTGALAGTGIPAGTAVPTSTDVLIVGGGVIGVCIAYYLAGQGPRVTLVERDGIACGCSYGNAGWVVPSHSIPLATPSAVLSGLKWILSPDSPFYIRPRPSPDLIAWLMRFAASANRTAIHRAIPVLRDLHTASRALYDELARSSAFDFDYRQQGMLQVCKTVPGLAAAHQEAQELREFGLCVEVLDADQIRAREPLLQPDVAGGLYFPDDARLNPVEFVRGLARTAADRSVQIVGSTQVLSFEVSANRITKIRTAAGDVTAGQVVLAAGSWSRQMADDLRLRLPMQPGKGYSITVKRPAACPRTPLSLAEARVAVTPLQHVLRFAGTMELAGMNPAINRRRVDAIMRAARAYLQDMDALETIEEWAGLRPCMPDGLPVIGRADGIDNLVVATGHAMLGVSLGPITGKLVSQLLLGQQTDIDLTPLSLNRF